MDLAFQGKRKMLRNSLSLYGAQAVETALAAAGLPATVSMLGRENVCAEHTVLHVG